ncbi:MAG: hypothetical protein OEU26_37330 [Candidatus Tectomicrobia bacterium]|nr:hypothetical protein [Candidatus Tectomicrobia bacterium]
MTSRELPETAEEECPIATARVRHLPLVPSTSWYYPGDATLRYLVRQKRRAETALGLDAVIVQDERGFIALWTGERPETQPAEHDPREAVDVPASAAK